MDLTLRCRAYLSDPVASEAWRHINIHRQIRNHAVRDYYSHAPGDRPSAFDQINKLPAWKRQWPIWKDVSAHAAQQTVSQIHKDVKTMRERRKDGYEVGRLRWQGNGEVRSVAYQSEGFNVDHNTGHDGYVRLKLSKIGWMDVRESRPIPEVDEIKRVVLKKEPTGEWFACFVVDIPKAGKPAPRDDRPDQQRRYRPRNSVVYSHDRQSLSRDTRPHRRVRPIRPRTAETRSERTWVGKLGETASQDGESEASDQTESTRLPAQVIDVAYPGVRRGVRRGFGRQTDVGDIAVGKEQARRRVVSVLGPVGVQGQVTRDARDPRQRTRNHERVLSVRRGDAQADLDSGALLSGVRVHSRPRLERRKEYTSTWLDDATRGRGYRGGTLRINACADCAHYVHSLPGGCKARRRSRKPRVTRPAVVHQFGR